MKALRIYVYSRNVGDYDYSNNGISSKYDTLLLVCKHGDVDVDEQNPPENLVKMVTRQVGSEEYKHIEPVAPVNRNNTCWTFGSSFAYISDWRFHSCTPLKIHDRQEG